MVKLDVVSTVTAEAVPEITPVDVFNDNPLGNDPDCKEYVIAPPSGSVATTVTLTTALSENEPNDPDAVVHDGADPAVIKAALVVVAPVVNVTVTPYGELDTGNATGVVAVRDVAFVYVVVAAAY